MYVIYDRDGILDGFRKYYLQELRKVVDCIVAVVSGALTDDSTVELKELCDDVFFRENKGLLVGSWNDGIVHIGWVKLNQYDELLMIEDSFWPVLPSAGADGCCREIRRRFLRCKKFRGKETILILPDGH